MDQSRRSFSQDILSSLILFSLVESLSVADLFGRTIKPVASKWLMELEQMTRDLRGRKLKQSEWHQRIAELFARVDLDDLLRTIDYDRLTQKIKFPSTGGEAAREVNLPRMEGVPDELGFVTLFFAIKKGSAIVPHGHQNIATMHLILDGSARLRQYDRVHSDKDRIIIRQTIDKTATRKDMSTISDEKDNVHWFEGISDRTFTFNIGIYGLSPDNETKYREYLDPDRGEKLPDGTIRAPRLSREEAYRRYANF